VFRVAEAALPYFQRAIQLDPNFAMGYRAVGGNYASLGELERAREYVTKAFELREHASDLEKLFITGDYYRIVAGEQDKAAQSYQEMIENYPRDAAGFFYAGLVYSRQGQNDRRSSTVELHSRATFRASIPPTFAERRISRVDRAPLPRLSFRKSSTTAAWSGTVGRER
jgi:tetratricopeptide (TPR) repeat protein